MPTIEAIACHEEHIPDAVEPWKECMVDNGDNPLFAQLDIAEDVEGFSNMLEVPEEE